jgi:hypothetical protein
MYVIPFFFGSFYLDISILKATHPSSQQYATLTSLTVALRTVLPISVIWQQVKLPINYLCKENIRVQSSTVLTCHISFQ